MTEKPIIFDANEVNAILAGNKTQHRIPILTSEQVSAGYEWDFGADGDAAIFHKYANDGDSVEDTLLIDCPFGATGNRLWVQELHARTENKDLLTRTHYYAGGNLRLDLRHDAGLLIKYAAENMPRWASRILLEITDIRIERVQDITHNDSVREAAFTFYPKQAVPPLSAFPRYWMEKHGDDAWRLNPWVWVIEFKVVGDNKIYQQKDSGHGN